MPLARGTFDVKLAPLDPPNQGDGSTLGRLSIDKQFHGDLEGTSVGQMLSAGTETKGSAGYVAIERVTGSLHGRGGSWRMNSRRQLGDLETRRSGDLERP
jgi:Protein of unknown function (DUF3224)